MAGLLVAHQIARAAYVEVVRRKLEPRAQRVQVGQNLQPLFRRFGDHPVGWRGEIGIGARLRPPDPPAKLIELRQAEAVRPVRSEEHTSELQSLMRISYAVFCLKKNNKFYHDWLSTRIQ